MRTLWILSLAVLAAGCSSHRTDSSENGLRDALACVVTRGGDAARGADLCTQRSFAPDSGEYRRGYEEGLACVRREGGNAAEAAEACRGGVAAAG